MVNYDCKNLNILHFDWLNLLQLKTKIGGGERKDFPFLVPLSPRPLVSSLAPFSYLFHFVDPLMIMSLLVSVTYLGQRLFVYISAPFLSIHSSVPLLPDSDTIYLLHSLAHYHMCKLGLFHWYLPFVTHSVRSCAVPVYP